MEPGMSCAQKLVFKVGGKTSSPHGATWSHPWGKHKLGADGVWSPMVRWRGRTMLWWGQGAVLQRKQVAS